MPKAISIQSFPKAIVHVDGDSFFVGCEVAIDPSLKGKPVITGKERGIVSAASYEAKALGVKRGMSLFEVRRVSPKCIILPSNYELYSLFSVRMYDIVRRYTPEVEEYSIDECFADITGLRRHLNKSYQEIAEHIKKDLASELGITFSVGLAPTKVLAKVASKRNKPNGLCFISGKDIEVFLKDLPVEKVWGIGGQTGAFLNKQGVRTALEFVEKTFTWVERNLSKPYKEIWHELRGSSVLPVSSNDHHVYKSIQKTKTFAPPSKDEVFVFSELSKNIENACIKARRHKLKARKIRFFIKTQDFRYFSREITLRQGTNAPQPIVNLIEGEFGKVFDSGLLYRTTGVTLCDLSTETQRDLFGDFLEVEKVEEIASAVDEIDKKFGKHTVWLGTSTRALKGSRAIEKRQTASKCSRAPIKGETDRKHLYIPSLGEVG